MKPEAKKLLDKLVDDLYNTMPIEDRFLRDEDAPTIIYNLFKGDYNFSYKTYNEIFNFLINKK